ncbi:MAG: hypothetical protein ACRD0Z_10075 [Acidimicrobiales bacterium]
MGRRSRELRERRETKERAERRALRLVETSVERGCLFCRMGDGGFSSVEHVFAESLGNRQLILPRGVVCDRCNNGPLSQLDQVLVDFMPIAFQRTIRGVPNKEGNLRQLNLVRETIEHQPGVGGADPTIVVTSKVREKSAIREVARLPDGRVKFKMTGSGGRRMTPRYGSELSRALLKSALECAWLDHGVMMLEPRFDHVRAAVLGEARDGFFLMATSASDPNSQTVSLTYDFVEDAGEWRMWVFVSIYGVELATDSRLARPAIDPPEDRVQMLTFTRADLERRGGGTARSPVGGTNGAGSEAG